MILGRSRSIVNRRLSSVKFWRTANRHKEHVDMADIQCFRGSDSIFDCAQIAEPDAIHRPGVRDVQLGRAARLSELVWIPRIKTPLARFTPLAIELRKIIGEPLTRSV